MTQSRQLAAIMFTDIVGYTALMGSDNKKALTMLQRSRALQKPIIEAFGGKWIKEMGDGVIASFKTASDALSAAVKIQEACRATPDFELRIGIHLGEVLFENNDVFGDGVNIASRIESLGAAGAVLISKALRDQVKNNTDFQLESLGIFDFKNVSEPIEVYAVSNPGFTVPKRKDMQGKLALPERKTGVLKWVVGIILITAASFSIWFIRDSKESIASVDDQSIAVLAFVDMSQAKDQEYFTDGLSENIIDLLAKVPALKVIGRTSSFSFKGRNEDLRVIGEKLGAANILEGSVQRDGNMLRITAQLIRSADGFHLWSDKFDRPLQDIFAVQDEIAMAILSAIKIELIGEEKVTVLKKYTENVEAYQQYLQGRFHLNKFTPEGFRKAIEYFDKAIAIDSTYAIAYADKAFCYMNMHDFEWMPAAIAKPEALKAAQRSIQLDDKIAESHLAVGRIKLHWERNIKEAMIDFEKAVSINPNKAEAHVQVGFCFALLGRNKEALDQANKAEQLDPLSYLNIWYASVIVWAVGDHERLLRNGERMLELDPNNAEGHGWKGMALLGMRRYDEAILELKLHGVAYSSDSLTADLGVLYGLRGEKEKARETINWMMTLGDGHKYPIGLIYASIGERDSAFFHFDKAVEASESHMLWIKQNLRDVPGFANDPRTAALYKKIGIPYP